MTGGIIPNNFDTIIPIEKLNFIQTKETPITLLLIQKLKESACKI